MQYLYEKLQRHNLITMTVDDRPPRRRDLGFRHSCQESGIACVFLRKDGVSTGEGLPQATAH
jgi:hypothetical protein